MTYLSPYLLGPEWGPSITAGCTGVSSSLFTSHEDDIKELCCSIGCDLLYLPQQTHSTEYEVLDLPTGKGKDVSSPLCISKEPCDALLIHNVMLESGGFPPSQSYALGVRTADCIPLLFRYHTSYAVVHAGWRGLAGGILQRVIDALISPSSTQSAFTLVVEVGPCISARHYEVGTEVLSAFELSTPCYRRLASGKALLDLTATASAIIMNKANEWRVPVCMRASSLCTFETPSLHSYRRDKELSGRNLSYLRFSSG